MENRRTECTDRSTDVHGTKLKIAICIILDTDEGCEKCSKGHIQRSNI